jgi:NHLM bacteriocin system ABC transporter ATP-binding protein
MSSFDPAMTVTSPLDLAALTSPARLVRPARLYAAVLDQAGHPGARHFLLNLVEGSAVFALAAPGVSFLLDEQGPPSPQPITRQEPLVPAGIDAWFAALLTAHGLPHGGGDAVPLTVGDHRQFAAGAGVTATHIVWLRTKAPILFYPAAGGAEASPAMSCLVLTNQIRVELAGDGEVQAIDTTSLVEPYERAQLIDFLGALSAQLAARIAAALIKRDTAQRERWQQAWEADEVRAAQALQRLRDVALFRAPSAGPVGRSGADLLPDTLAVLSDHVGFALRVPLHDNVCAPLSLRLEAYAIASGFRCRRIALDGNWWKEEGPPFIAIEGKTDRPLALVFRRGRWRIIEPRTLAETVIDEASAARLTADGYMLYPSLPDTPKGRDVWRFSTFGMHGDIRRLLIAAAAASFAGLLMPIAIGSILGVAIPDGRFTLLTDMLFLLLAAAAGSAGFQVARAMSLIRLGTHLDQRLQAAIWDRVLRLRTSFFRQYSIGDLTWRMLGVDAMRRIMTGQLVNAVVGGVFSLASLGIMLIYDAILTLFAVGYTLVAAGVLIAVGRFQKRQQQEVYDQTGIVSGLMTELIRGIAKLRVTTAELRAYSRWSDAFARQRFSAAGALRMNAIQVIAASSLPFVGAIGIFGIAASSSNAIDVASFAAFNSAFGQFTAAMLSLTIAFNSMIEILPLYARLQPILAAPLEVEQHRIDPGELHGGITARNLWFRYKENGPWVLEDVDIKVRSGESIAIVGASGSGKSTLLRLLLGFEAPTRGGIYYDDHDLKELDLRLVRRQIGAVLENSDLFPGSLYENITGSAALPAEQVMEAAQLAGLGADIAAMPRGIHSALAEGGRQLSGGQRQQVMIARALVNRPRLLFFDHALAILDNPTQAIIGESIAKMSGTRLVVTNRLNTLRDIDRIVVLEAGRIVESGRYDDLVAKRGPFHRLLRREID